MASEAFGRWPFGGGSLPVIARRSDPARTHERKKRRSKRMLELERDSPLHGFFTGGVEYDDSFDPGVLARFLRDFDEFVSALAVSPEWGRGIEIKFRRLGKHRADGLFYPDRLVLVVDVGSCRSFAHEFGHLMDYSAAPLPGEPSPGEPILSTQEEFEPLHRLLLDRLEGTPGDDPRIARRKGRLTRPYFASPAECFARGFEQCAAESLPTDAALAGERGRYRADPLFLPDPPRDFLEYYRRILRAGPGRRGLSHVLPVERPLGPAQGLG